MLHRRFGEFLVDEGYVTEEELERGLAYQRELRTLRLGELLLRAGVLRQSDLTRLVEEHLVQIGRGLTRLRFGEWLAEEGHVTPMQVQRAVWRQWQYRNRRIGEILVEMEALSQARLDEAIRRQLQSIAVN
jgi:hypothetical protein